MTNHEFEELLKSACVRQDEAETAAAGLTKQYCARKIIRGIAVAVACAALLTFGAAAVWPQLELTRTGENSFSFGVNSGSTEDAPRVTGVDFSYLPNGYTYEIDYVDPQGKWAMVAIENPDDSACLIIEKFALDYTAGYSILDVSENYPKDLDPVEQTMEGYLLLDSGEDLTKDVMKTTDSIAYTTADYYYVVTYPGIDLDDAYNILKGME